MGMRERQILRSIELPLASPVIVGGFRTATLSVIATATIGAILSGGGLGRFIFDGLNQGLAGRAVDLRRGDPRHGPGRRGRPRPRARPAAPDARGPAQGARDAQPRLVTETAEVPQAGGHAGGPRLKPSGCGRSAAPLVRYAGDAAPRGTE